MSLAKNSIYKLMEYALEQKEPPCDSYKCEMRSMCSKHEMCCQSFVWYAMKNRVMDPRYTAGRYHLILEDKPRPSKKIYEKLFSGVESTGYY